MHRREVILTLAATGALSIAGGAAAQSKWPEKPVRLIVPFPPGGPTDTFARMVAARLQTKWNSAVVVDYKPGAGTVIGTEHVAKSAPDGYTLGVAISAHAINTCLRSNLPYDTLKDLVGVSHVVTSHYALFAHPSFGPNTIAELIAYAKQNPGKLNYATPGTGTGTHLAGELLNSMAGIQMVHIPYKGSAPALQDVIGGRVPLLFDILFSSMPYVRDKRLKVLGVASPKRVASNPDIPAIAETVPGFSGVSIMGIYAPSGTPKALLDRISADIAEAIREPDVIQKMASLGMEPVGSSPQEYDAVIRSEIEKWCGIIRKADIRID